MDELLRYYDPPPPALVLRQVGHLHSEDKTSLKSSPACRLQSARGCRGLIIGWVPHGEMYCQ